MQPPGWSFLTLDPLIFFLHRNLYNTETLTKQDPYVNVWVSNPARPTVNSKFLKRTKTHDNGGRSAIWDETYTLDVEDFTTDYLYLQVMNENSMTADKEIGKCSIACKLISDVPNSTWVKIYRDKGVEAGEVMINVLRPVARDMTPRKEEGAFSTAALAGSLPTPPARIMPTSVSILVVILS